MVDLLKCTVLSPGLHKGYAFGMPEALKEVKKRVKIPLVLHGASCVPLSAVKEAQKYGANLKGVQGVPDAQIKQAVKNGICKFNTDTDLRIAFDAGIRKNILNKPADFDPRHILAPAREYMQKVVEHRIRLFGSGGKTSDIRKVYNNREIIYPY